MKTFKEKVLKTIEICNIELNERRTDVEGESTISQIEDIILPELNDLLEILCNNKLPPRDKRFLNSFANAFMVWGWDMQNPTQLFLLLAELNNQYKEL